MEVVGTPNLLGPIGDGILSPVSGSGTTNTYAKWTSPTTLGNGLISDDGATALSFAATSITASIATSLMVGTAVQITSTNIADFYRNQNAATSVWCINNTNNTAAQSGFFATANNGSTSGSIRMLSANFTTSGPLIGGSFAIVTNSTVAMQIGSTSNVPILFWVNNANVARFNTSSYFGVGGDPTSTIHTFGSLGLKPTVSNAGTLGLDATTTHYVFSGTTTTWTLPAVASAIGRTYFIKNRGSGAITLNSDAGSTLYTTSAVGTLAINPGEAYILINDGTYFNVQ